MSFKIEFYRIVGKTKRNYIPSDFKEGEPVRITIFDPQTLIEIEFYRIVGKTKRFYIPSEFNDGKPVRIIIERVVSNSDIEIKH